jgi:hypothetical protein
MILRVENIKNWHNRPYSKGYITKGLDALKNVALNLLFKNKSTNEKNNPSSNINDTNIK